MRLPETERLTDEQRDHLLQHTDGAEERARLIQAYLPLAAAIAHEIVNDGVDVDDLRGEAVIGLCRAVDCYDPEKADPKKAAGYFSHFIKGQILTYLDKNNGLVALPQRIKPKLRKAFETLVNAGVEPDAENIAKLIGRRPEFVEKYLPYLNTKLVDLDSSVPGADDSSSTYADVLPDGDQPTPEQHMEEREKQAIIAQGLRDFADELRLPIERVVFNEVFLGGRSAQSVGERLGVSQSSMSRVVCDLRARMQEELEYLLYRTGIRSVEDE